MYIKQCNDCGVTIDIDKIESETPEYIWANRRKYPFGIKREMRKDGTWRYSYGRYCKKCTYVREKDRGTPSRATKACEFGFGPEYGPGSAYHLFLSRVKPCSG